MGIVLHRRKYLGQKEGTIELLNHWGEYSTEINAWDVECTIEFPKELLERMLHRGKYSNCGEEFKHHKRTNYTRVCSTDGRNKCYWARECTIEELNETLFEAKMHTWDT